MTESNGTLESKAGKTDSHKTCLQLETRDPSGSCKATLFSRFGSFRKTSYAAIIKCKLSPCAQNCCHVYLFICQLISPECVPEIW